MGSVRQSKINLKDTNDLQMKSVNAFQPDDIMRSKELITSGLNEKTTVLSDETTSTLG